MDTYHSIRPSEEGSVVVDIGGDVGAAIVHAPASLVGFEVEIRRCEAAWDGAHVAVRDRHVADDVVHAAFFPGLGQGKYEARLRMDEDGPVAAFTVEGGRVTETDLGSTMSAG